MGQLPPESNIRLLNSIVPAGERPRKFPGEDPRLAISNRRVYYEVSERTAVMRARVVACVIREFSWQRVGNYERISDL